LSAAAARRSRGRRRSRGPPRRSRTRTGPGARARAAPPGRRGRRPPRARRTGTGACRPPPRPAARPRPGAPPRRTAPAGSRCAPAARRRPARRRPPTGGRYAPRASVGGRGGGGLVAAGALVQADEVDPALVALLARERLGEEQVDQRLELLLGVLARADGDDVGVVVLTGQAGRVLVPHQGGPHAGDLVRRDLLAVAGAADHDAERAGVRDHGLADVRAERRIVVQGVVLVGAVVGDLVPLLLQDRHQAVLELEAGVVGADVHAHVRVSLSVVRNGRGVV